MDEIRIAVVDDEKIFADLISNRLHTFLKNKNVLFGIDIFTSGMSFLSACSSLSYDLVYLDIDMPEITGLDIAQKLRMKRSEIEVIFITNKDDLVYDTIRYTPFRFIRKSRFELEFEEAIEQYLSKREAQKALFFFSTEQGKRPINVVLVSYIEVQSHKLTLHLPDETIFANGNLSDIEKKIQHLGFIRIHSSYLVNFRYIDLIDHKSVILDDKTVLPLSRGRSESTKMALIQFSRRLSI